ncbi:hypothetical protein ONZ45_g8683 [Pleurotus djamor]|nr:hypothetical protein ONZ45_g8683 [Pleurotus djamor]
MNVTTQNQNAQPYTILRIKRKRNEEPLDALVVETATPRKKSRGRMGMFQFAQTVEPKAWEDEAQRLVFQEELQRLAAESSVKALITKTTMPDSSTPPQARPSDSRRYTVVMAPEEPQRRKLPTHPPVVVSHKDIASPAPPKMKMYDAVLATEPTEVDPEMEKFLPMIQEYLKLHDINPADEVRDNGRNTPDSDDYVWDVFYHRPATLSEWNNVAAKVATLTGLPPSDEWDDSDSDDGVHDEADEDSNAEDNYKNDYPDEESSDDESDGSDCFHEDSDYEDIRRDPSEHDWR